MRLALCLTVLLLVQTHAQPLKKLSAKPYLLKGNQTDSCLDLHTLKKQSECLQELVEVYYGGDFTIGCPNFALVLTDWECRGCPWDRINSSALLDMPNHLEFGSLNHSELFHEAEWNCRIAYHAALYRDYREVHRTVFQIGTFGSLTVVFVTAALGVYSNEDTDAPKPWWNSAQMLILWFAYNVGYCLVMASQDFFYVCESLNSLLAMGVLDVVTHATIRYVSLRRCLHLPSTNCTLPHTAADSGIGEAQRTNQHVHEISPNAWRSWATAAQLSHPRTPVVIAKTLYYGSPVLLALVYLCDIANAWKLGDVREDQYSMCHMGRAETWFGYIQYSKIVIEMLAVSVYAYGAQRGRAFHVRYGLLCVLFFSNLAVLALSFNPRLYTPDRYSMLIPRVLDSSVAGGLLEFSHVLIITSMGLLEPVRIGWPSLGSHKD